jgi:hypothetical protein
VEPPAASAETRKRILRAVLNEIVVKVEPDRLHLMLHWQGGDHTRLEVVKNRTGQHRWKTDTATEELIRELARLLPDQSIASVLNRLGMRSAKGHTWTQVRVRNFRCEHQITIYREGERAERHELILHEAATEALFGVRPALQDQLAQSSSSGPDSGRRLSNTPSSRHNADDSTACDRRGWCAGNCRWSADERRRARP